MDMVYTRRSASMDCRLLLLRITPGTAVLVTEGTELFITVRALLEAVRAEEVELLVAKPIASPGIEAGFAGQGIDSF